MSEYYIGSEHFRNIGAIKPGTQADTQAKISKNEIEPLPADYLKYDDSGHNLFAVEGRLHVDIEQICEGLTVIGFVA